MKLRTKLFYITFLTWLAIIGLLLLGLHITIPHLVYEGGLQIMYKFLLTFFLIGIIILVMLELTLKYFIVNRIVEMKMQLKEMLSQNHFNKKLETDNNDEISDLANCINELVQVAHEHEKNQKP